jgi:SMI1/KNR4 family protein SUKH-1
LAAEQEYNWQELMARWSRDMLASRYFAERLELLRSEYPGQYTDDVVASGWLGYPPATDTQIEATEKRLDLTLPPDYKAFLKVANGWRAIDQFINRVWPVEEIDWFSSTDPDYVAAWVEVPTGGEEPLYESRYIASTMQISDEEYGGTAVLLLNPKVVSPSGEWEAWFMSHWNPGANRYSSFWEMMQNLYSNFLYVEASV